MKTRVAIVGTHCTGKSTLIEQLKQDKDIQKLDFVFIESPTRSLKEKGLHINNKASNYDETQRECLIYDRRVIKDTRNRNVISDRCLLDTFIYTQYLYQDNKVTLDVYKMVDTFWRNTQSEYTIFILTSPKGIELKLDNARIQDVEFRNKIHDLFIEEITNNQIKSLSKFFIIEGTEEERLEQAKTIIIDETKRQ